MDPLQIESRLSHIESRIQAIDGRNARVEAVKSWETSGTRIAGVALTTYLTMNLILWTIGGPFPPLHAIIPTAGYLLSTLSLPVLKKWWISKFLSRKYELQHRPEDTL